MRQLLMKVIQLVLFSTFLYNSLFTSLFNAYLPVCKKTFFSYCVLLRNNVEGQGEVKERGKTWVVGSVVGWGSGLRVITWVRGGMASGFQGSARGSSDSSFSLTCFFMIPLKFYFGRRLFSKKIFTKKLCFILRLQDLFLFSGHDR